jgi:hypothetical protein
MGRSKEIGVWKEIGKGGKMTRDYYLGCKLVN